MNATALKTVTTKKGLTFTKGASYKCLLIMDGSINIYVNKTEFATISKSLFSKFFK